MISGDPKFQKADMPTPACFISDPYKALKLWLKPAQERLGVDNTVMRVPNTGCRVEFKDYRLEVVNSEVLAMILEHRIFKEQQKVRIDPEDPTGFWRANGIVKEQVVHTYVTDPQPNNFDTSKIKAKVQPPAELNTLVRAR